MNHLSVSKRSFFRIFTECSSSARKQLSGSRRLAPRCSRGSPFALIEILLRLVQAFHHQVSRSTARGERTPCICIPTTALLSSTIMHTECQSYDLFLIFQSSVFLFCIPGGNNDLIYFSRLFPLFLLTPKPQNPIVFQKER